VFWLFIKFQPAPIVKFKISCTRSCKKVIIYIVDFEMDHYMFGLFTRFHATPMPKCKITCTSCKKVIIYIVDFERDHYMFGLLTEFQATPMPDLKLSHIGRSKFQLSFRNNLYL